MGVSGATIPGMTLKEHIIELVQSMSDDDDRLQAAERLLETDDSGNGSVVKAKKRKRLSFSAIGASDASGVPSGGPRAATSASKVVKSWPTVVVSVGATMSARGATVVKLS